MSQLRSALAVPDLRHRESHALLDAAEASWPLLRLVMIDVSSGSPRQRLRTHLSCD